MLVRWPEKIKPAVQEGLYSTVDFFASFAGLLGYEIPQGQAPDSRNYLNTLIGTDTKGCDYVIQQNLNNTLSIVKDGWKYIETSDKPALEFWTKTELGNSKEVQLYNVVDDPSEKKNVAKENPEKTQELEKILMAEKNKFEKTKM